MNLWPFKNSNKNTALDDKTPHKKFVALIVMDGLGISTMKEGNSVLAAKTPFLDTVWTKSFSTLIHAAGVHVGLPEEYAGNSEVGHLNIGSGQVIYQSLPKINDSINTGRFTQKPEVLEAFKEVKKRGSKLHLMGILSNGGVHGHIDHLFTFLDVAKEQGVDPYIHAFVDGRDTGGEEGFFFMSKLNEKIKEVGVGKVSTVSGRLYAMDRDKRWERTQATYDAMTGISESKGEDPIKILQEAYARGENDQILPPTMVVNTKGEAIGPIEPNDVVIFYNYREDRARQITKAFVQNFDKLKQPNFPENLFFVSMTGYDDELDTHIIFPPHPIETSIARVISEKGLNQMHISETEKFMHVTYFFNGGVEDPFPGEDLFNIPSPKVFDYSDTPEMSARIIQDEVLYRLNRPEDFDYSFFMINLANPDMLGHTGNVKAATKGVEVTDEVVKEIVTKVIDAGGAAVLLSDHGNCEEMIDPKNGKVATYHSINPVPFIVVTDKEQLTMKKDEKAIKVGTGDKAVAAGILADVAPTCLAILDLEAPPSMTGVNLMEVL
jgi:2,3-bisphosphoglycerate-independent phosphoglycerate mutase